MLDLAVDFINKVLSNDLLRTIEIVITGIFAGYILQPVPRWLNSYFDTSTPFKFIILLLIGLGVSYPVTPDSLVNVVLTSIAILVAFALARRYDSYLNEKPITIQHDLDTGNQGAAVKNQNSKTNQK